MRVICIDSEAWPKNFSPAQYDDNTIQTGNSYNVCDSAIRVGHLFYELREDMGYWYYSGCFAPTSNINELELLEQRQTQLV